MSVAECALKPRGCRPATGVFDQYVAVDGAIGTEGTQGRTWVWSVGWVRVGADVVGLEGVERD